MPVDVERPPLQTFSVFFFSSRRRHTRLQGDWSSDVCSSDLQFLADVLEARVERPVELETTALGAAFLAGLATGVWSDLAGLARTYSTAAVFVPRMTAARRATLIAGWRQALERALHTPSVRR